MTGWAWHLANGPTLLADIDHATGKTVTWDIAGPGSVSFSLDGHDPIALLIQELVTDVIVSYDGARMWRGRIGATTDDIDGTSHKVTVNAVDYRGVLERRLTTTDYTETSSPANRAWQALNSIQSRPAGDLGITRGTVAPGTARSLTSEWGETIAAIIDRWGGLYPGGFDWWIDGDLIFHTSQGRGAEIDWALVYGETVTGVTRSFDPGAYANVVRASGADGVTPVEVNVADLATRPEGRWETQLGDTNLKTATSVQAKADGELLRAAALAPDYTFTVTPGTWTPDRAWLGDLPRVKVRSGRVDADLIDRITAITVTDTDGAIDVAITTGSDLRRGLSQLLRHQAQQLSALARR